MWPFKSLDARIVKFWEWFASVAPGTGPVTAGQEPVPGLTKRLWGVRRGLAWAVAPPRDGDLWVLGVSADGQRRLADTVRQVVRAAPAVPGWRVVAFRQPTAGFRLRIGGHQITPEECRYVLIQAQSGITFLQVYLPVPDSTPASEMEVIGFALLDSAFGEEWVLSREVVPFRPVSEARDAWPLSQLLEFEREAGRVP